MLAALSRLLHRRPRISIQHPVLGQLQFDPKSSEWSTADGAPIYHGGIPGDATDPNPDRVTEVLTRLGNADKYWQACSADLLTIASMFHSSIPQAQDPRQLFRVAALSLYPSYWEICFQTKPEYKWLYVGMQFEGEDLVSNTIDT